MITTAQAMLTVALAFPAVAFVILVGAIASGHPPPERRTQQIVGGTMLAALVASIWVLVAATTTGPIDVDLGTPIAVRGYHFDLAFRADIMGACYLALDILLCGLVGAFSERYLHREPGYHRFFVLLLAFVVGVAAIATGRGLDLVFAGWELVGLTSALLIAFFHDRRAPVENGLLAYGVYRVTDVGLLLGVVILHHATGAAELHGLSSIEGSALTVACAAIAFGTMGKGAIFPFTPWLPRAMEGPTPSSAIFYGALSIHASPFLLIRIAPALSEAPAVSAGIVALGLLTATHASMAGRAQNDIKSALGYASVTQVGLMWIWIGLGWSGLAFVHLIGHALYRTWQLLRSPSLFLERRALAFELGRHPAETGRGWAYVLPTSARRWLYRFALERWHLEAVWAAGLAVPAWLLDQVDRLDRRWASSFEASNTEARDELEIQPLRAEES